MYRAAASVVEGASLAVWEKALQSTTLGRNRGHRHRASREVGCKPQLERDVSAPMCVEGVAHRSCWLGMRVLAGGAPAACPLRQLIHILLHVFRRRALQHVHNLLPAGRGRAAGAALGWVQGQAASWCTASSYSIEILTRIRPPLGMQRSSTAHVQKPPLCRTCSCRLPPPQCSA